MEKLPFMEDNVKQSKDWRSPFMTREEALFSLRITPLNIDRYQIDSSGLELVCFSGDAKRDIQSWMNRIMSLRKREKPPSS